VPKWPSQVLPLTAAGLPRALAGPRPVGIHCWARWNAYDYEFAERLRLAAERFAPLADLYALDTQHVANAGLVASWGILNVPAFVLFRRGVREATLWMERESVAKFQERVEARLAELAG
jgi:hypothetical protein